MKDDLKNYWQLLHSKLTSIEREGDELLRTNPQKFHNKFLVLPAAAFVGLLAFVLYHSFIK